MIYYTLKELIVKRPRRDLMNNINVEGFPDREFSFFCEFQVAFELQKKGWQVYQPLIDRYIDLIALKNDNYKTIQVKSSRIEKIATVATQSYESYGLTMKPKDLFHDIRHFYIWVFVDKESKFHYFIFNVKDFIDIRYHNLAPSSRRKHPSLLMRGEWRWGTDRLHPRHFISGEKINQWEVEGVKLNAYKEAWEKLEAQINVATYNLVCIQATELDNTWKVTNGQLLRKWKQQNDQAELIIKKYPEVHVTSQKLLKLMVDEEDGIMDAHLLRLSEADADRIFKETTENWEVFFPLAKTDHVLLFKPICANCGNYWNTSLKECFFCKTKYYRIKVCESCNRPYPENIKPDQRCDCGGKIVKKCMNCGQIEKGRKRVFVPITFCWLCGNRQNTFEFKRFPIGKK